MSVALFIGLVCFFCITNIYACRASIFRVHAAPYLYYAMSQGVFLHHPYLTQLSQRYDLPYRLINQRVTKEIIGHHMWMYHQTYYEEIKNSVFILCDDRADAEALEHLERLRDNMDYFQKVVYAAAYKAVEDSTLK